MEHAGAFSVIVGRSVRSARTARDLSQEQVAERMRALGFTGWLRQTVGQVERGRRRLIVDEVLALSFAVETTVAELIMPAADEEVVELPSGQAVSVAVIRHSIRGNRAAEARWRGDTLILPPPGEPFASEAGPEVRLSALAARLEAVERQLREERARNGHAPQQAQPVVAAIVTSARGVLIGKRNDRTPPWTFIAGEQEPGERPADTITREVKEEAALEIRAGEVIGERDHPRTGRHMIYLAARPARGMRIDVGDEAELAEVRWASLAEALELMPDMFGRVREHLEREIGGQR